MKPPIISRTKSKLLFILILLASLLVPPGLTPAKALTPTDINSVYRGLEWLPDGLAAANCYIGGSSIADVPLDFSLGTDGLERRVALVKYLAVDYALTPDQAAGIVGNFMWESGGAHLPPDINEYTDVSGPPEFDGGYGWAQWTGVRQVNFVEFAIENGYMESDQVNATDAANYAFLKYELSNGYSETITAIKNLSTPEEVARSFHETFEKSLVWDPERAEYARQVYNEFLESTDGVATYTCEGTGTASIVGGYAFPLLITGKSGVGNPGIFANGTTSRGGHPYIAFDIYAEPGTPVGAFLSGTVTRVTTDKCGGRFISIYNSESDLVISYLHLNLTGHVGLGESVGLGQEVGVVGSSANGCGTPHLHIDAALGDTRPGCKRESCPPENQAQFVDIGPQLYETYEALPD